MTRWNRNLLHIFLGMQSAVMPTSIMPLKIRLLKIYKDSHSLIHINNVRKCSNEACSFLMH